MKNATLWAAAGIIAASNAFVLLHAARNRAGAPDADIVLTQRELMYYGTPVTDDNTGVTLHLEWTDRGSIPWTTQHEPPAWLGQPLLEKLGFDCSVPVAARDAAEHYQRQRPRRGYVALELNGPAWRSWLEDYQRAMLSINGNRPSNTDDQSELRSRLVTLDADADPAALRARHPDRGSVLIAPAVFALEREYVAGQPRLLASIRQLTVSVHVPRPFSDQFRSIDRSRLGYRPGVSYRVRLRYGALYEPWVAGVEIQ